MLSAAELAAQIRQTAAFIAADPVDLSVSRYAVARVPGGGKAPTGSPTITSRRVRMIPAGDVNEVSSASGSHAERREWVLLGLPDVDIKEGDQFTYMGYGAKVETVTVGQYELKAQVVSNV